jgi:hypothetical protein
VDELIVGRHPSRWGFEKSFKGVSRTPADATKRVDQEREAASSGSGDLL